MAEPTDPDLEALRRKRMQELRAPPVPAPAAGAKPTDVTDATFADFLRRSRVTMLDFWATWCGPCRVLAPIVEELAREYAGRVAVGKIDVDANPRTPMTAGVMGMPTIVLYRDGREVDRVVGAVPKHVLKAAVDRVLA